MASTLNSAFTFREEYTLGEFVINIRHLEGREAEQLAAQIRTYIKTGFEKSNPILCSLYAFEIQKTQVWAGSRKSKNHGKLKRKKGKTIKGKLRLLLSRMTLGLSLGPKNPLFIQENWEMAVQDVEDAFGTEPPDVEIEDLRSIPLGG